MCRPVRIWCSPLLGQLSQNTGRCVGLKLSKLVLEMSKNSKTLPLLITTVLKLPAESRGTWFLVLREGRRN